ncbi:MAG: hsp70 family protein [Syntrophobacteraceae bacterium]|jgi:molecular chaperone DnaK (HSP70)|nr:hsp70 family protein [Syntrophobacteraceae bacterium]
MESSVDLQEVEYRYIVGMDLGTTNTALAYVDRTGPGIELRRIRFLNIPQLVSPGSMGRRPILPSFLYIPGPYELPPESTALPWDSGRSYVVGELAREQGALVPGRLVSSAKSWLCHGGVDRTASILPWGAGSDVEKVSPVEASSRYLRHLREAWNAEMARGREGFRLEEQLVLLTVPASFDEVARELTVTAAREAGLNRVILIEEPLAAFYAWLSGHEDNWREGMRDGQLILVCDVGGGTTDFTVIAVREGEAGLKFDRLAVGDHLMLGGDNMDLSLARHIEVELMGQPGKLESRRWHQLWHQCRKAKESLLGGSEAEPRPSGNELPPEAPAARSGLFGAARDSGPTEIPVSRDQVEITLVGLGRKLIGDTLKARLSGDVARSLILDGFFPQVALDDLPTTTRRKGLTEWGLPYVQEPAVTRHLAGFWNRFRELLSRETGRDTLYPDFVLFNGGSLSPPMLRERVREVLSSWFKEVAGESFEPIELKNPRPDLAVAIGAAYYGLVRLGEGVRVGAGSPRSFFVEVAPAESHTGEEGERHAVCLVPRGTEEGYEVRLEQPAFNVLTNQPVSFQLFCSSTRLGDHLGDLVTLSEDEISVLPPIRTVLRYGRKVSAQPLPVSLAVRLTEVGTLELWCASRQTPHRWQLQFDVRQGAEPLPVDALKAGETLEAALIESAQEKIRGVFGTRSHARGAERITGEMVSILELPKEKWPSSLIRKLADTLLDCKSGRSLTAQHEARWLNLLGFCVRPGFGDPVDEWRIKEIWKLFPQGPAFPRQAQNRSEWWVFWRRVAGGLSAGQQWHLFQQISGLLQLGDKRKKPGKAGRILSPQEEMEIWMAVANMERLPVDTKLELGEVLLGRIRRSGSKPQDLWALSRVGARIPFYGPLNSVIPGSRIAGWLEALRSWGREPSETLANALVQMARFTGDRERDLDDAGREAVMAWLDRLPHPERYRRMLLHPESSLLDQEREWVFGESLPAGLTVAGQT